MTQVIAATSLYSRRRGRNNLMMVLACAATLFGVGWLVLVLGALLWQGIGGLSLAVFTEMTPPPGAQGGGLLNPIVGSLIMTVLGVAIGTPIGILAGTYMAEYGRHSRLTSVIRFINDTTTRAACRLPITTGSRAPTSCARTSARRIEGCSRRSRNGSWCGPSASRQPPRVSTSRTN
jgi:hypothetical protein